MSTKVRVEVHVRFMLREKVGVYVGVRFIACGYQMGGRM